LRSTSPTPLRFTTHPKPTLFPYTTLFRSGENATSSRYVRSSYIEVLPGQRYTIHDKGINNQLDYWWVFEYDVDGKYIGSLDTNRSEEHTSELQSRFDLVCRLLLEKKNISK